VEGVAVEVAVARVRAEVLHRARALAREEFAEDVAQRRVDDGRVRQPLRRRPLLSTVLSRKATVSARD